MIDDWCGSYADERFFRAHSGRVRPCRAQWGSRVLLLRAQWASHSLPIRAHSGRMLRCRVQWTSRVLPLRAHSIRVSAHGTASAERASAHGGCRPPRAQWGSRVFADPCALRPGAPLPCAVRLPLFADPCALHAVQCARNRVCREGQCARLMPAASCAVGFPRFPAPCALRADSLVPRSLQRPWAAACATVTRGPMSAIRSSAA